MDNLKKYIGQVKRYVFFVLLATNALIISLLYFGLKTVSLDESIVLLAIGALALAIPFFLAATIAKYVTEPISFLWQAILHVSPENTRTPPPNLDELKIGREMVTSLSMQVYQLASASDKRSSPSADNKAEMITNSLPLPVIVIGKDQTIVFANEAAARYINQPVKELTGKNFYSVMDLSFTSQDTLDTWLNEAKNSKLTDTKSWDRVRLKLPDNKGYLLFDMAAYYNKNNPSNVETILALFDHTKQYSEDDEGISFVSLAVHELRTPLTLLRGYIEVFQEELSGKLDEELNGFLNKMQAASQQLTAFVNNILNVARIDSDQLTLQLDEERWADIVQGVVNDLNLRAKVQGRSIEFNIAEDLPTVAADRVSIYEVLSNLIDNAIKYSLAGGKIIVSAQLGKDGLVETTVQDFGVGIPSNVLPNLFEKFYRNFKTKEKVGGTGLGLYLSKAIITAHGGNIWVNSKEGQGTIFGFTLKPYQMLAAEEKNSNNKEIVRGAHGWIKNHSLYRR